MDTAKHIRLSTGTPKGMGQIGDVVMVGLPVVEGQPAQFERFILKQTGLEDDHKHRTLFRISNAFREMIVSPHDRNVFILVQVAEYREFVELRTLVTTYRNLVVIREPTNDDNYRYRVLCLTCGEKLGNCVETTETADLEFRPTEGFVEGRLNRGNCGTVTICRCDGEYEIPDFKRHL